MSVTLCIEIYRALKILRYILFLAFLCRVGIATCFKQQKPKPHIATAITRINNCRCSPDWNLLNEYLEETDIPPMPGAGKI